MKLSVMIQYVGHVVNAGGTVTYRLAQVDLTDEQAEKLKLKHDEFFSVISIDCDDGDQK